MFDRRRLKGIGVGATGGGRGPGVQSVGVTLKGRGRLKRQRSSSATTAGPSLMEGEGGGGGGCCRRGIPQKILHILSNTHRVKKKILAIPPEGFPLQTPPPPSSRTCFRFWFGTCAKAAGWGGGLCAGLGPGRPPLERGQAHDLTVEKWGQGHSNTEQR